LNIVFLEDGEQNKNLFFFYGFKVLNNIFSNKGNLNKIWSINDNKGLFRLRKILLVFACALSGESMGGSVILRFGSPTNFT